MKTNKVIRLTVKPGVVTPYDGKQGAPRKLIAFNGQTVLLDVCCFDNDGNPFTGNPCTFTLVLLNEVAEGNCLGQSGQHFLFSNCFG